MIFIQRHVTAKDHPACISILKTARVTERTLAGECREGYITDYRAAKTTSARRRFLKQRRGLTERRSTALLLHLHSTVRPAGPLPVLNSSRK